MWAAEWRRPQANEWEKHNEAQAVALFVRLLARAEAPNAPVTLMKYVREFRAELGISADGAARRRWTMPAAENARPASITAIRSAGQSRTRSTAKDRFRVTYTPPATDDNDPAPF
ncbi:hypothetical protein [Geodermatophilus sp. URMC 62]|uniref:hypothetical protein n=1 Tax=Geodermatophilus sp. URMC 62 TaxID=3423414 RepID=UPI00406BE61F